MCQGATSMPNPIAKAHPCCFGVKSMQSPLMHTTLLSPAWKHFPCVGTRVPHPHWPPPCMCQAASSMPRPNAKAQPWCLGVHIHVKSSPRRTGYTRVRTTPTESNGRDLLVEGITAMCVLLQTAKCGQRCGGTRFCLGFSSVGKHKKNA